MPQELGAVGAPHSELTLLRVAQVPADAERRGRLAMLLARPSLRATEQQRERNLLAVLQRRWTARRGAEQPPELPHQELSRASGQPPELQEQVRDWCELERSDWLRWPRERVHRRARLATFCELFRPHRREWSSSASFFPRRRSPEANR